MGASLPQRIAALGFGWPEELQPQMADLIRGAGPLHQVVLDAYYIDKVEVTNEQYRIFVDASGHRLPSFWRDPDLNHSMQPVTGVSWFDARTYCAWAGKRLPTEAEWEKAARGTEGLAYPWGDIWDPNRLYSAESVGGRQMSDYDEWTLWIRESITAGGPTEVGSYPAGASPYGVLDMAGNVWEWVADWYDPAYYENAPEKNPKGAANGTIKVVRGGAWDVPWAVAFTWFRERFVPPELTRSIVVGFRCVADEPPIERTDGRANLAS
ncbi:MAG: SUMF1/EgtB/PvdO family nonheme iron enzyme [Chloroflexi bacterium]|nr:SUMF1/EgtB/PvdO family nonheme iron enzyme [Chloroflexota bacterium]